MRTLRSHEKAFYCPYCSHGAPYVKGSEISKSLARENVYQHVKDAHAGHAVYAKLGRGYSPFDYDRL